MMRTRTPAERVPPSAPAKRRKLDPITQAVLHAGLIDTVAEMKAVVVRTAYSNLWKEAGDLSCGLLTRGGEIVVQGKGDIPVHLGSMPMSLAGCLKRIPPATLSPGDVLYQNDPYQGNNHLPDFIMAKPILLTDMPSRAVIKTGMIANRPPVRTTAFISAMTLTSTNPILSAN